MKIFFILLLCICYTTITAQEQNNKPCGTKTPSLKWETWFSSKVKEYKIKKSSNAVLTNYTIPVIVHILHDGDIIGQNENISWAQVKSQIDILNADFSGTNSDISNVPPIFQSVIAGNTGIQFCLAKTDQDGNVLPEEGIDRINWVTKGWDDPESFWLINGTNFVNYYNTTIKPESIWDPHRYLNIWLSTKNILNLQYGFGLFPTGAGFSELPNVGAGIETQTTSGVWVHHERWGNIGTVNNNPFNTNRLGRVGREFAQYPQGANAAARINTSVGNHSIKYGGEFRLAKGKGARFEPLNFYFDQNLTARTQSSSRTPRQQ